MVEFDECEHKEYDRPCKTAVMSFLKDKGVHVVEGSKYGIDLLCEHDAIGKFGVEVETKVSWKTGPYPYKDVHIPLRKEHMVDKNVIFFVTSLDYSRAMAVWSHKVADRKVIEGHRRGTGPEEFMVARLEDCKQYILNGA